ncbi:1,6-dihydroxycyclohexa-2,4-diene-1-carboxylate dehydrogenase [Nitrincola tapanii]|uniref:1,6-dihydroxycyclohexa-2,4-diene-1-carboxylate dehydrogenase n=1 Tax=Nitrincola tapanii TaxID=1708751 RepID=A0A5A9W5P5_9GAMM|nr:1,6-dihydroxycyclohexa-2,4-diene-1-carboxylate dehydrogenase [Nitrincola tapanii]KAA0875495.1 1,6-dihydroxycyclohexa-2,4-diene-1-carboxylate dehydrogenase [Nitrincola tapanii]
MKSARFAKKVVVVTGAAQGIGRAVALQLAQEAAQLFLVDRSELVEEVAAECQNLGAPAVATTLADLERFADCERVMQEAHAHYNRIDVLINNVGGTIWAKPFEAYEEDQIEAEIRRSLFPTLWCCRAVLPYMQTAKSGAIVNVSSIATRGINRVPYSAAKGGVNALTLCLAMENATQGIRINAVAPGGTDVGARRIPRNENALSEQEKVWYQQIVDQTLDSSLMHRYSTPDEQANAILFMASDDASYITGTVLPVGGGDLG